MRIDFFIGQMFFCYETGMIARARSAMHMFDFCASGQLIGHRAGYRIMMNTGAYNAMYIFKCSGTGERLYLRKRSRKMQPANKPSL